MRTGAHREGVVLGAGRFSPPALPATLLLQAHSPSCWVDVCRNSRLAAVASDPHKLHLKLVRTLNGFHYGIRQAVPIYAALRSVFDGITAMCLAELSNDQVRADDRARALSLHPRDDGPDCEF